MFPHARIDELIETAARLDAVEKLVRKLFPFEGGRHPELSREHLRKIERDLHRYIDFLAMTIVADLPCDPPRPATKH